MMFTESNMNNEWTDIFKVVISDYNLFGIILIATVLAVTKWYLNAPRNIPPGPRGYPIVGNILQVGKSPHETFAKLGEKYGNIFRLQFGSRLVIVLNDYDIIREAFIKMADVFSDRPHDLPFNVNRKKNQLSDKSYMDVRKFTLAIFRDFGVGKGEVETRIMDEILCFTNCLQDFNNTTTNFSDILGMSVSNNICNISFGHRFEYNDRKFQEMKNIANELFKYFSNTAIWRFFPWTKYIPGFEWLTGQRRMKKLAELRKKFICNEIDQHILTLNKSETRDYVYSSLHEGERRKLINKDDDTFCKDNIISQCVTLFAAGTETTHTSIKWAVIYMMLHPDIQKKIHKEIDNVIGLDRNPTYEDRLRTPFIEATILELGRIVTIIPFNLPHSNNRTVRLGGYVIPKGSYIMSNLWNVHHDPKLWGDPEVFRPERFLNSEGNVEKPPFYIPFSIGKRACLGEVLARMELYLYFTTMMQKFEFLPPEGQQVSTEGFFGVSMQPKCFQVHIKSRIRGRHSNSAE